jgi:hypothetical protein
MACFSFSMRTNNREKATIRSMKSAMAATSIEQHEAFVLQ